METDPLAAMRDSLGEDLCALLHRGDVPVREVQPLIARETPDRPPRAFRVLYADGQARKAVRCAQPAQAALVVAISRRIDPAAFAPVLAHAGAALLMPWIDGVPLHATGWDVHEVQHGGRMLAALHAAAVPEDAAANAVGLERYATLLRRNLAILVRQSAIAEDQAQALLALAQAHAPSACSAAVVHRDLCPENLVRQPSGALRVVDVETLSIGARDYDLARTWYRWPMPPDQRQALFDAYVADGGRRPDWHHFPYWAICATASSAAQRQQLWPAGATIPLQRLGALRRHLESGSDGQQLALRG